MIITRTPLRISFFGGGTDISSYYRKDYGCVLGMTIDKYIYLILNKRFEKSIRVSYRKNEIVDDVKKIKHDIIRESLKFFGIKNNIEVVTVADIPGTGTGLGSSSSLTVGLCNALSLFVGKKFSKKRMAEDASYIEINKILSPIGKQDQYFAAFGGLLFLKFNKNGHVKVEHLKLSKNAIKELETNTLAFYTGISRKTNNILKHQTKNLYKNKPLLDKMREFAEGARDYLKNNNLIEFAGLLDKNWNLKKQLSSSVSNPLIDSIYKKAIQAGAIGGKIAGSGGGGFILLYCEPNHQKKVRESLKKLTELRFSIDNFGTQVTFDE